jgi:hypothetical protein
MTAPFVANPHILHLETIKDLPLGTFTALPDHPAQRQTVLHAARLISSGVLDEPLDQHREVAAILIGRPEQGDTIESLSSLWHASHDDAFSRRGHKLNGHTRTHVWSLEGIPAPATVRTTVYAATDMAAATKAYNALDSLIAVKARRDMNQTTVRVAKITPNWWWLRQASGLSKVLQLAATVCGSTVMSEFREVLLAKENPDPIYQQVHRSLPLLASVHYFKPALEALDALAPTKSEMPLGSAFIAGYLSVLHRDGERGREFLEKLQTEKGAYMDGLMDAFYAIKMVENQLLSKNEKQKIKITGDQRDLMVLANVLNAYEGWKTARDFKADKFPTDQRVIATFNPVLREELNAVHQTAVRARNKAAERKAAERRERDVLARRRRVVPAAPAAGSAFEQLSV